MPHCHFWPLPNLLSYSSDVYFWRLEDIPDRTDELEAVKAALAEANFSVRQAAQAVMREKSERLGEPSFGFQTMRTNRVTNLFGSCGFQDWRQPRYFASHQIG